MAKTFTFQDFTTRFPNDDACLEHLMKVRYGVRTECPKCGKAGRFIRLRNEPAFCCPTPRCGHHIHPMVGTPFHRTHTALSKWFYAMYLFTTSRHGVPAKELQRQLGVTYKTAWRMGHEIRKYMAAVDGDAPLGGNDIVEADKAFIGGKDKRGKDDKTIVLGMVERGGDLVTRIVPNRHEFSVVPHITENVIAGSRVATDEGRTFMNLRYEGFDHGKVNHSKKEYVRGDIHTNTIESFWSRLKASIRGTHIHVSPQHLSKYLGEFEFRFNLRKQPALMFDVLLLAFPKP